MPIPGYGGTTTKSRSKGGSGGLPQQKSILSSLMSDVAVEGRARGDSDGGSGFTGRLKSIAARGRFEPRRETSCSKRWRRWIWPGRLHCPAWLSWMMLCVTLVTPVWGICGSRALNIWGSGICWQRTRACRFGRNADSGSRVTC